MSIHDFMDIFAHGYRPCKLIIDVSQDGFQCRILTIDGYLSKAGGLKLQGCKENEIQYELAVFAKYSFSSKDRFMIRMSSGCVMAYLLDKLLSKITGAMTVHT